MKIVLSVCLLLLLSACSVLSPVKPMTMQTYLLKDPVSEQGSVNAHSSKTLLVSLPSAPQWLNTRAMAYKIDNGQINYFAENQWAAPPAQLLQPIIVHALQHSGLYGAVVPSPFGGTIDERLDIQVIQMQQNFTETPSIYSMILEAQLVNANTGSVIKTKRFTYRVPAAANPQGGVDAANKAIEEWIPQLVAFCRGRIQTANLKEN